MTTLSFLQGKKNFREKEIQKKEHTTLQNPYKNNSNKNINYKLVSLSLFTLGCSKSTGPTQSYSRNSTKFKIAISIFTQQWHRYRKLTDSGMPAKLSDIEPTIN